MGAATGPTAGQGTVTPQVWGHGFCHRHYWSTVGMGARVRPLQSPFSTDLHLPSEAQLPLWAQLKPQGFHQQKATSASMQRALPSLLPQQSPWGPLLLFPLLRAPLFLQIPPHHLAGRSCTQRRYLLLVGFREFVQSGLKPCLPVTVIKMSGAGPLGLAQGTDDTHTHHKRCPHTVTAQTLTLCNSSTELTF